MMHTAPMAPSAPAPVAHMAPAVEKPLSSPWDESAATGTRTAMRKIGDADAQQGPQRVSELHLAGMQRDPIHSPRKNGAEDEQ